MYIDDEKITYYDKLLDMVSNMIKKTEFPILVVYQLSKKEKEPIKEDKSFSKESFLLLKENIEKLKMMSVKGGSNRFRPKDKFLNYDQIDNDNIKKNKPQECVFTETHYNSTINNSNTFPKMDMINFDTMVKNKRNESEEKETRIKPQLIVKNNESSKKKELNDSRNSFLKNNNSITNMITKTEESVNKTAEKIINTSESIFT